MRRALLALFTLLVLALLIWTFLPQPISVEVARIAPGTVEVVVEEEGVAQIREIFTMSATIGGKLRRIDLHAGDEVIGNETVVAIIGPAHPALLDARSRAIGEATLSATLAAVDLARAEVVQATAQLDFRIGEAERASTLFDRAAVSRHHLDLAILERKTAQAALDSARANLTVRERERDSAQALLDTSSESGSEACCVKMIAPVSGWVLRVLTEDEQVVSPGMPILEVGDPAHLVVNVDLLSRDAVRVQPGAEAWVTGWGGADIKAKVERIEPAATTRTSALGIDEQRVAVRLHLIGDPQDWHGLGHGYRVVARITLWKAADVLSIPVGALFRDGSDWATYVVKDGHATLRRITLGERNDEVAQVLEGLRAGDFAILHPSDLITNGSAVTLLP